MIVFIVSSGYGRAGTTWMQKYLSTLDGMHAIGQPTPLSLRMLIALNAEIITSNTAACVANNEHGLGHHLVVDPDQVTRGIRMLIDSIWFGQVSTIHRAVKLNGATEVQLLDAVYPDSKYVCCVRHPWRQYWSLVNTFVRGLAWSEFSETWCANVTRALVSDRTFIFQLDRSQDDATLRQFLGLDPTPETDAFLSAGEKVHAGSYPPAQRDGYVYPMGDVMQSLMREVGYE